VWFVATPPVPIFGFGVMRGMLTDKAVRAAVADILHLLPDEVRDTDNLFDHGLDSIRLLSLLERWRDAGAEVSFMELAEQPTIEYWLTLLTVFAPTGGESGHGRVTAG
jgi:aryl carrier-like protein